MFYLINEQVKNGRCNFLAFVEKEHEDGDLAPLSFEEELSRFQDKSFCETAFKERTINAASEVSPSLEEGAPAKVLHGAEAVPDAVFQNGAWKSLKDTDDLKKPATRDESWATGRTHESFNTRYETGKSHESIASDELVGIDEAFVNPFEDERPAPKPWDTAFR